MVKTVRSQHLRCYRQRRTSASAVSLCVASGFGTGAAVSAAGTICAWCTGEFRSLGHGDTGGSPVSKQVQALAGLRVLSVAIGHCLAVTEEGDVFSWGVDMYGQCSHGRPSDQQLLPRRVEALAGVRARCASAGGEHSLVVTEDGVLYCFGHGFDGRLGHGRCDDAISRGWWLRCAMCATPKQPPVAATRRGWH